MARLLYGNFDFEHELGTPHYNRPQRLARLNAELTACLIAIASDHDQIWCPEPLPENCAEQLADAGLPAVELIHLDQHCQVTPDVPVELAPWGWSQAAFEFAQQAGVTVPNVNLDAVRKANSRGFSFDQEQSLAVAPPRSVYLESSRQLVEAIADSAAAWGRLPAEHRVILKAEFGMSGRERFVLRGDEALTPSVHGWINRRVEQSGAVYLEPWLDRVVEFSTHWEITQSETVPDQGSVTAQAVRSAAPDAPDSSPASSKNVRFVGLTQLLNTPHGQYSGSRVGAATTELPENELDRLLSEIKTTAERAAASVAQLGYAGPIGIDAMIYRDAEGALQTRPVQDINARWSMGRVALSLQQRRKPAGCLSLLKVPTENVAHATNSPDSLSIDVNLIRLTPDIVGGKPCSEAMVAVRADSSPELLATEQRLLDQLKS
jgi:hypothetical protein